MKITKRNLKILIERFLNESESNYPYAENKRESDRFRQWLLINEPDAARSEKINVTTSSGDPKWDGLVVAYEKYGDDFEAFKNKKYSAEEQASNPDSGVVILCHWKGSKPVSSKIPEKLGIAKDAFEFLFPQGHAGIIIINSKGESHYFDFGRYRDYPGFERCDKEIDPERTIADKIAQSKYSPTVIKNSYGTGGIVRYKNLGKAKLEDYKPSVLLDPIKSYKKYSGTKIKTISNNEAVRLGNQVKGSLPHLEDGEFYIVPDVDHVNTGIKKGIRMSGECFLYSATSGVNSGMNCSTFTQMLATLSSSPSVSVDAAIRATKSIHPFLEPATVVPYLADLMDYEEKVNVP